MDNIYFLKKDPHLNKFYVKVPVNGNTGGDINPDTNFTDFSSVHSNNCDVPVNALIPLPLRDVNIGISLSTRGTGPIQRTLDGNCRGKYSTDFQYVREEERQVASGENSALLGGYNNRASGISACVLGGRNNTSTTHYSCIIGGEGNRCDAFRSVLLGGSNLKTTSPNAVAVGEYNYDDNMQRAFIVGNGRHDNIRTNAFSVRQRGDVYASGTFTPNASNADFGEYFQTDGGQEKIPVGTSVVIIVGSKFIRPAIIGEVPIGVISNTCGFIGNKGEEWNGMYERDIDGNYVYEGDRIKISPSYDHTKEFIPRDERPEWNLVGLLGQVKILKGEAVAPNWIYMGSHNDKYDLWFIK